MKIQWKIWFRFIFASILFGMIGYSLEKLGKWYVDENFYFTNGELVYFLIRFVSGMVALAIIYPLFFRPIFREPKSLIHSQNHDAQTGDS